MLFIDYYKANGFEYFKLWENDGFVLFKQCKPGISRIYGFELIKKVLLKPVVLKGISYPERYKIPKNEDFGIIAWSYDKIDYLLSNPPNALSRDTVLEIQRLFVK